MVYSITKIVWVCSIDNTEWDTKEEAEAHERELLKKAIEEISTSPDTYFYTESTCSHLPVISHILIQALKYTSDPQQYCYYQEQSIEEMLRNESSKLAVMWQVCDAAVGNAPDIHDKLAMIVKMYLPEYISNYVTDELINMRDKTIAIFINSDKRATVLVGVEDLIAGYKDKVDMADSIIKGWRDHVD